MNTGAFGEGFPYTNFHDLNLDWILSVIHEFKAQYPDIITELEKKIDKPLIDANGSLNDVLFSNGDGTTRWDNISIAYADAIESAVNSWLDEHPEATTTVEDDSITIRKLNIDTLQKLIPAMEYTDHYRTNYQAFFNNFMSDKTLQSVCYDSLRRHYIVGFSTANVNVSYLLITPQLDFRDISSSTPGLATYELNLGHCNDLEYDPVNDVIYVATGTTDIVKLNPSTFDIIERITTNIAFWTISRFDDGRFYVARDSESRIYNEDFTEFEIYSVNNEQTMNLIGGYPSNLLVMQGSIILYGKPFIIYNIKQFNGSLYFSTVLASLHNEEIEILRTIYFQYEVESGLIYDNKISLIYGQSYVGVLNIDLSDPKNMANKMEVIREGSDLNDYKTPGLYIITNPTIATSLLHIPLDATYTGGVLHVEQRNQNLIAQTIYGGLSNAWTVHKFERMFTGTGWYNWQRSLYTICPDNGKYSMQYEGIALSKLSADRKSLTITLHLNERDAIKATGFWIRTMIQDGTYIIGSSSQRINVAVDTHGYRCRFQNTEIGVYIATVTKIDGSELTQANGNNVVFTEYYIDYMFV